MPEHVRFKAIINTPIPAPAAAPSRLALPNTELMIMPSGLIIEVT
jgi:hypothetical protein